MKQFIRGVLPVGAPWGGVETVRFISCLSSLYLHVKQPESAEELLFCPHSGELCDDCGRCGISDREKRLHEQIYFELLTLSGLNCRTHWDPEFRLLPDRSVEISDRIEGAKPGAVVRWQMLIQGSDAEIQKRNLLLANGEKRLKKRHRICQIRFLNVS